jgi:hypothetical protein
MCNEQAMPLSVTQIQAGPRPYLYFILEVGLYGCLRQCCTQHDAVIPAVPAGLQLSSSNVLLPCQGVTL